MSENISSSNTKNKSSPDKNISKNNKTKSKTLIILFIVCILVLTSTGYGVYTIQQQNIKNWKQLESELRQNNEFNYQQIYNYVNDNFTKLSKAITSNNLEIKNSIQAEINKQLQNSILNADKQLDKLHIIQAINSFSDAKNNSYYWGSPNLLKQFLNQGINSLKKLNLNSKKLINQANNILNNIEIDYYSNTQKILNRIQLIENLIAKSEFKIIKIPFNQTNTNETERYWLKKLKYVYHELKSYIVIKGKETDQELTDRLSINSLKIKCLTIIQNIKIAAISNNVELFNSSINELISSLSSKNLSQDNLYEIKVKTEDLKTMKLENILQDRLTQLLQSCSILLTENVG